MRRLPYPTELRTPPIDFGMLLARVRRLGAIDNRLIALCIGARPSAIERLDEGGKPDYETGCALIRLLEWFGGTLEGL